MGSLIARLFGLSAVAGILTFVLLAPIAAVASYATTTGFTAFNSLAEYIKPVNAAQASTIYGNQNGEPVALATFYHENRVSIDYDQMSKNMINAVISTEDPRFFQHVGVDILSLTRATLGVASSGLSGPGGSTITMQYIKNSLIEAANIAGDEEALEAATITTIDRKIREIRFAMALETVTSKEDILAGYLNLSFFGNQLNGIESASNYYFGVKAKDLTVPQAALLTAMLRAPNDYKPDEEENLPDAKIRRDYVINNMRDEGFLTSAEAEAYKKEPVTANITPTATGCEANQSTSYYCDYVVWTIRNSPEFGQTPEDREMLLRRGGLEIYTSMDLALQNTTDEVVKREVPVDNQWALGAASVSVQVGTGRVLAMSQNRVFNQVTDEDPTTTSVNYSTDKTTGGSSGFQTGSTYKVFVLAEWLSKGFLLGDRVDARNRAWQEQEFKAKCGGLGGGDWEPGNFGGGDFVNVNVLSATASSINTAYVNMASQLDLCDIRDMAERFGIKRSDGNPLLYVPSSVLGVNELSPLSMAAAMAGFANNGIYCTPIALDKVVVRATGEELKVPASECARAVSAEVAAAVTYSLETVITGGTGTRSRINDGVPIAGKTGTTDETIQSWMTGYSSKVSTATWVGNVVGKQSLNRTSIQGVPGNSVRHDIWRQIMAQANATYGGDAFTPASSLYLGASTVTMPVINALLPEVAETVLKGAGLSVEVAETTVPSPNPVGSIAYANFDEGSSVVRGSLVTLFVSKGGMKAIPNVAGKTVAEAKGVLNTAGFLGVAEPVPSQAEYFVFSDTVPDGNVVGTFPESGTFVELASGVVLKISKGPRTG
jgi:membrane peptidoglycan carboxypeptidase